MQMLDLSTRGGEDRLVTDPEELRSRAASIFGRLRGAGPQGEHAEDDAKRPASAESEPPPALDGETHSPVAGVDASPDLPDDGKPVEAPIPPTEASAPPATTEASDLSAAATAPTAPT